jgi:hypothetical protein
MLYFVVIMAAEELYAVAGILPDKEWQFCLLRFSKIILGLV